MILRAGLTGGIASGKSTAAKMFAELGCEVLDADALVRELYKPGESGHRALVAEYGETILDQHGEIDRVKLSAIALETEASAERLNSLIHPLVIELQQEIFEMIEDDSLDDDKIVIVEATLLLEAGGRDRYDRIIVVDVPPAVQLSRALDRGMSEREFTRRRDRQMEREDRIALADYVIDNGGSVESLTKRVREVHAALVEDAKAKKNAPPDGGASV